MITTTLPSACWDGLTGWWRFLRFMCASIPRHRVGGKNHQVRSDPARIDHWSALSLVLAMSLTSRQVMGKRDG
jgi:hypothetical protein